MRYRYVETHFSAEHRFSMGNDLKTGGHYLSIPVTNGAVDYEEYYYVTAGQYGSFVADTDTAARFAEACRRREHDVQLIYPPSDRRGTPI